MHDGASHELLHGLEHAARLEIGDGGVREAVARDVARQLLDDARLVDDGDGRARYELLVAAYGQREVLDAQLWRRWMLLRLLLLLLRLVLQWVVLAVDGVLDEQVAVGAYLGKHGPTVLADHGAGVRFEQDERVRVLLLLLWLGGDVAYGDLVAADDLEEEVGHAALVEGAKEARQEGTRDGVGAADAALVAHHVAESEAGVVLEELVDEAVPPGDDVVQVVLLLIGHVRQALVHLVQAILGLHVQRQPVEREVARMRLHLNGDWLLLQLMWWL